MLKVQNLHQYYGGSHILRDVSLSAEAGKITVLLGRNGVGKTTTIGKLASQFRAAGKKVVIAAGDTFRAAADVQPGQPFFGAGVESDRFPDC